MYKCIKGSINEVNTRWNDLINMHPNDNSWIEYKNDFINAFNSKTRVCYYGILDGKIICETTAIISVNDKKIQNADGLISNEMAYLTAFRTNKEYENKGYFSKLYKYMEKDLKSIGYKKLSLGVEPCEVRNMMIYFHFGYTNYIKSSYEKYYSKDSNGESVEVLVNYYYKEL